MISLCKPLRQPIFSKPNHAAMKWWNLAQSLSLASLLCKLGIALHALPAPQWTERGFRTSVFVVFSCGSRHSFNCQQAVQELASLPKRLPLTGFRAPKGQLSQGFHVFFGNHFARTACWSSWVAMSCYVTWESPRGLSGHKSLICCSVITQPQVAIMRLNMKSWTKFYKSSMFPQSFPLLFSIQGLHKPWPTWPLTWSWKFGVGRVSGTMRLAMCWISWGSSLSPCIDVSPEVPMSWKGFREDGRSLNLPRLSYFESADYKKSETAYNQARWPDDRPRSAEHQCSEHDWIGYTTCPGPHGPPRYKIVNMIHCFFKAHIRISGTQFTLQRSSFFRWPQRKWHDTVSWHVKLKTISARCTLPLRHGE